MPSEVRFAVVRKFLEKHGWKLVRISSSHHIFAKQGQLPISIPVHRDRVKAVYVHKIKKICGDEETD